MSTKKSKKIDFDEEKKRIEADRIMRNAHNLEGTIAAGVITKVDLNDLGKMKDKQVRLITPEAFYLFNNGQLCFIEPVKDYQTRVGQEIDEVKYSAQGAFQVDRKFIIQVYGKARK